MELFEQPLFQVFCNSLVTPVEGSVGSFIGHTNKRHGRS